MRRASLGKSMRIFKSEVKELQNEGKTDTPVTPAQPPTQVQSERVEAPVTPPRRRTRPTPDRPNRSQSRRPGAE